MKYILILLIIAAEIKAATVRPNGYWTVNCSQYVSRTAGISDRTALAIWNGDGLKLIGEFDTFEQVGAVRNGTIAAFHGSHVAIFHNGHWMDSDPNHNGIGRMTYNPTDTWFRGKVRLYVTIDK